MKNTDFAMTHQRLAFGDYRAGRHLFLNGFYTHALILSSTAVEKYLKSMLAFLGLRKRVHLDKMDELRKLFAATDYHFIPDKLDEGFLSVLGKSYKYRYYDDVETPESIGFILNQFLGELDYTVAYMESAFILTNDKGERVESAYQKAIKNEDPAIVTNNYILQKIPKKEFMNRVSDAYAVYIDPVVVGYEVSVTGTNITPFYEDKINLVKVNSQAPQAPIEDDLQGRP